MRGRKSALTVRMDEGRRQTLLGWLRAQKTPVGLAKRAWAMPLLAAGQTFSATAKQVGLAFVAQWNEHAHPFHGSTPSAAKVMAKCEVGLAA